MVKVGLQGIQFFAWHGFYPEEQVSGNNFVVDVEVSFLQQQHFDTDEIGHTVNYEQLYAIAERHMGITRKLLETVVQGILDEVKETYPFAEAIRVSLKKLNPPIKADIACSLVEITYRKPDEI
ncbi:dihydroneopterin aldolase [Mucilaginibacter sp. HMF5004]|uniref:dihydroneopterin aldolase n=1 Tax=Mucilaginibacter rivuli TaxID=2857527 RepID=UPI001C5CD501|nr:dihydroneopterin aldolase [Mucilaginibacter rivuli]MBW4891338.1 dihydroneopterin aldolase [Mucilaginibacter rivuli]